MTIFQQYEKLGRLAPFDVPARDLESHLRIGKSELADAKRRENSITTRFKAANDSAHNFLLIALKAKGYRPTSDPGHRQILYDLLPSLVPGATAAKESLDRAHKIRNRLIYEGAELEVTEGMVEDVISGAESVLEEVEIIMKAQRAKTATKQAPSSPPPVSAADMPQPKGRGTSRRK